MAALIERIADADLRKRRGAIWRRVCPNQQEARLFTDGLDEAVTITATVVIEYEVVQEENSEAVEVYWWSVVW